jgi:hypothetical protein
MQTTNVERSSVETRSSWLWLMVQCVKYPRCHLLLLLLLRRRRCASRRHGCEWVPGAAATNTRSATRHGLLQRATRNTMQ